MVSRKDYTAQAVEAARSVLVELVHLLGEYRDDIVLIGGWIPEILLSREDRPHVGSMDVDLALNHRNLEEEGYRNIRDLLLKRGYQQGKQPFIFYRDVDVKNKKITVQIDLLAGEYEGTGKSHRHQKTQGVFARKVRGCDLAFEMNVEITIEGTLPGGGKDSVCLRVASMVPFLIMKGMALDERLKEKDAWDIYYCILNFPGGTDKLVKEFLPYLQHGLVQEGLKKIAKHFATESHLGPKFVADFEEIEVQEDRDLIQRDAYERISSFLKNLGM